MIVNTTLVKAIMMSIVITYNHIKHHDTLYQTHLYAFHLQ